MSRGAKYAAVILLGLAVGYGLSSWQERRHREREPARFFGIPRYKWESLPECNGSSLGMMAYVVVPPDRAGAMVCMGVARGWEPLAGAER